MATLTAGYSFGSTETVTNTKLGLLVSGASITGIINADIDSSAAISDTKLDLATIAQSMQFNGEVTGASVFTMSSNIFKLAKGADVASAAGAITLGDDGNYFDITGTAAITSITAKTAGTVVTLQFDSTATLTDGSNLKLNSNFTGAAEATITLVSDGTNWFEVCRNNSAYTPTTTNALSGSVIQVVNTIVNAQSSALTTTIPSDDSIPQNTEGTEVMTLAITPSNASNKLLIRVGANWNQSTGTTNGVVTALFQDSTANALSATIDYRANNNTSGKTILEHYMTAGTTSSTTFKVRIGPDSSATLYLNGDGTRFFGGVCNSFITIMEIKA